MRKRKTDLIAGVYFRQILCSLALPILLCVVYLVFMHAHNESQVEGTLRLEVNAVIANLENSHQSYEERINRYFLKNHTLRNALLDAHEGDERVQALYYASRTMDNAAFIDLNGNSGVIFVSKENDICIGTDIVQGSLQLLQKIYYTSQPTFEAWQEKYLQKQSASIYYSDSYGLNLENHRVTRSSYYVGRNQKGYYILLWWNADAFADSLALEKYEKVSYTVYNAFNEPIIEQNYSVNAVNMPAETRKGVWIGSLQGEKVFFARQVSKATGMSYCYAVDYAEAMAQFALSNYLMLGMLALCLLASALTSLYIAKKNAKPIHEMVAALESEPETVVANNFRLLSSRVKAMASENRYFAEKTVQDRQHMQQILLKKIILEGESANIRDAQELGLERQPGFCVLLLHVTMPTTEDMDAGADSIQESLIAIIQKLLPEPTLVWQDKMRIGILVPAAPDTTANDLLRTGEQIIRELKQLPYIKLRIGVGQRVESYRQIAQSYYFAKAALAEAARLDLPIFFSHIAEDVNDTLYSDVKENQLKNLMKSGHAQECEKLLTDLYNQYKTTSPSALQMFLWNLILIMQRMANGFNNAQLTERSNEVIGQMARSCVSREFDDVFGSIRALAASICDHAQRHEQSRGAAFIEFIHAHYTEADFGMQHMLDRFNMSQTSFQVEFKRSIGSTFGKYLETLRMTYAAEMLRQGRMNIAEIALHCGYLSDVSFRRVFKKYYGVSPTEYKKMQND